MFVVSAVANGCGDNGGTPVGDEPIYVSVSGSIVNLSTQAPVADSVMLATSGVSPAPSVQVNGSMFAMSGLPANSIFDVSVSGTGYTTTSNAMEVIDSDIAGTKLFVVPEAYFASLKTAFGSSGASNALILRVENSQGDALAGFATNQLMVAAGAGPFVLDANRAPAVGAQTTTASGYIVYFNLAPGLVTVTPSPSATQPISGTSINVNANAVAIGKVVVGLQVMGKPKNVSFRNDVSPIFAKRGCTGCHDGGGPGKDLGGLHLNGAYEKMYKELTQEVSPNYGVRRVLTAAPDKSLVLTMPSLETPPDPHPNSTFRSKGDFDYLTILAWIEEGAKNN